MKSSLSILTAMTLAASIALTGCGSEGGSSPTAEPAKEKVTILVAAAASLEYSFKDKLIPLFQEKYDTITVEGAYDSSGKLQTQIEEGLEADVFMSAANKQMTALKDGGLVTESTIVPLLENKIVLIKPKGAQTTVTGFENAADAAVIALGDPESTPVGQYAQEAFTTLGNWDAVSAKASLGTTVTEVLNWVGEGSADIGVVYATDATTALDKVELIAEAPEGSHTAKVIYPVGMVAASAHPEEARLFIDFLQSPEALTIFAEYGFTPNAYSE